MYKSMYVKGVNACISQILESVLIFSEAKGLKQQKPSVDASVDEYV